jgi:hypothetical protein
MITSHNNTVALIKNFPKSDSCPLEEYSCTKGGKINLATIPKKYET